MTGQLDLRVRDVGSVVLALRRDLRFVPQWLGGRWCYVVEDPVRSKFFRLGVAEYTFLSLLDGRTTLADALRLTATALPESGFGESEAGAIARWVVDSGLARTHGTHERSPASSDEPERDPSRSPARRFDPLSIKVPFGRPDRWLARLAGLGAVFTPVGVAVWLAVLVTALRTVVGQWDAFVASSASVLALGNWVWLGLAWLGLKIMHELGHGLACRRFGGEVREAGVLLILLTPVAYVDVTSAWRFRSKWHRAVTGLAGMYVELFVASLAILVWSVAPAGPLRSLCFDVATLASLTTLLFNANPLMRFDGYYVLADLLDLPNLATQGQQYLGYLVRRYVLGMRVSLPVWSPERTWFVRSYGVAAGLWRIVVSVGLLLAAATLFHGAGLALAVAAILLWTGRSLGRFVGYLRRGRPGERPHWLRAAALLAGTGGATYAGALYLPWPLPHSAPAVVEYAELTLVRTKAPGFVRRVAVSSGQSVAAGELLFELENADLAAELADLELRVQQSVLKSRQLEQKRELADFQAERNAQRTLERLRDEKREQLAELTVCSPQAGRVVGRELQSLLGRYVETGAELCLVGDEANKELRMSVPQSELDTFAEHVGEPVSVRLPGRAVPTCRFDRLSPRASLKPPHEALCAPAGGPLAVRPRTQKEGEKDNGEGPCEFFAPRFTGFVSLPTDVARELPTGQRATVRLSGSDDRFGPHLVRRVERWLREKFRELSRAG